jgi:hypothetical protein
MANALKWDAAPVSRGNVLSSELNSLADASRTNAGTEVDNSANLDTYGVLELNVDFGTAPDGDASVIIYMVSAPDGSNYAQGSSSVDPGPDAMVSSLKINASTSAQRKVSKPFLIPPSKVKFILENQTGQAFPGSGSTLELFTYNEEIQ